MPISRTTNAKATIASAKKLPEIPFEIRQKIAILLNNSQFKLAKQFYEQYSKNKHVNQL